MRRRRYGIQIVVKKVGVSVEHDLRRGMAGYALQRKNVEASARRQRCASVPQVVRRDLLDVLLARATIDKITPSVAAGPSALHPDQPLAREE